MALVLEFKNHWSRKSKHFEVAIMSIMVLLVIIQTIKKTQDYTG